MSLKDDVRAAAVTAGELADKLHRIAELIPEPAEVKGQSNGASNDHDRAHAVRCKTLADEHDVEFAEKLPLRDMNGKRLRVGDKVTVYNSERFGTATGQVVGPCDRDAGRVHVVLHGEEIPDYFPTVGRVERTDRATDLQRETTSIAIHVMDLTNLFAAENLGRG